jgi:putative membrane protein
MQTQHLIAVCASSLAVVTAWSVYHPHDRFTWWLEVIPAFIVIAALAGTYTRFPLTHLLYVCITLHCIVLLVGGHYTYAEVPLFNTLRDMLGLQRNYYDRVGHFFQGLVPALVGRELLLRTSPLKSGKWMFALLVLSCLGISAIYELVEWITAISTGEAADAFLGTQGDVWDTQNDMLMAGIGAVVALTLFARVHNRALRSLIERDKT